MLTEEQQAIVNQFCESGNGSCEAVPGAGKTTTILAICKATEERIQILTYNRNLCDETKNKTKGLKHVMVDTYHSFAKNLYGDAYYAYNLMEHHIDEKLKMFTDIELNTIIKEQMSPKLGMNFKILIIDEMQDMSDLFYRIVCKSIYDSELQEKIRIIGFGDPKQMINRYTINSTVSEYHLTEIQAIFEHIAINHPWYKFPLTCSKRLTEHNAKFICTHVLHENKIMGVNEININNKPKWYWYQTRPELTFPYVMFNDLLNGLMPENTLILCNTVKNDSMIRRILNNTKYGKEGKFIYMDNETKYIEGRYRVSTFHKTKGCEAKTVIFISPCGLYYRRIEYDWQLNPVYVALTRTTQDLHIFQSIQEDLIPTINLDKLSDNVTNATPSYTVLEHYILELYRTDIKKLLKETMATPAEQRHLKKNYISKVLDIYGISFIELRSKLNRDELNCIYTKFNLVKQDIIAQISKNYESKEFTIEEFLDLKDIKIIQTQEYTDLIRKHNDECKYTLNKYLGEFGYSIQFMSPKITIEQVISIIKNLTEKRSCDDIQHQVCVTDMIKFIDPISIEKLYSLCEIEQEKTGQLKSTNMLIVRTEKDGSSYSFSIESQFGIIIPIIYEYRNTGTSLTCDNFFDNNEVLAFFGDDYPIGLKERYLNKIVDNEFWMTFSAYYNSYVSNDIGLINQIMKREEIDDNFIDLCVNELTEELIDQDIELMEFEKYIETDKIKGYADLIIGNQILYEFKCKTQLEITDKLQTMLYLSLNGIVHGILFNIRTGEKIDIILPKNHHQLFQQIIINAKRPAITIEKENFLRNIKDKSWYIQPSKCQECDKYAIESTWCKQHHPTVRCKANIHDGEDRCNSFAGNNGFCGSHSNQCHAITKTKNDRCKKTTGNPEWKYCDTHKCKRCNNANQLSTNCSICVSKNPLLKKIYS